MISHLIAVFIGAAFVGVPIGIFVMALLAAGRERERAQEAADNCLNPKTFTYHRTQFLDIRGIDWSRIGV